MTMFIMVGLPVGHLMVGHPMVWHLVALQRVLEPKLQTSIIISYRRLGSLVIMTVFIVIGLPVGHLMVGHPMVRRLVVLQRVSEPKLQTSIIISYSRLGTLVIMTMFIMIGLPVGHLMVGLLMVWHLVALQRVLEPKLRTSIIISYGRLGTLVIMTVFIMIGLPVGHLMVGHPMVRHLVALQ